MLIAFCLPPEAKALKAEPYTVPVPAPSVPSTMAGNSQPYNAPPVPAPQSTYSAPTVSAYSHSPSGIGRSAYNTSEGPLSDYGSSAGPSGSTGSSQLGLAAGSQLPRGTASPNQQMSKAAEAGLLSVPEPATFHADSGVRFDQNGNPQPVASGSSSGAGLEPISDVPPTYTEN